MTGAAWTGRMRTSMLNDRQVRAIEYTRWADAHRRFEHRPKDREAVEQWKERIRKGRMEPLHLGVSDRDGRVYVRDGHHRAVALMELGEAQFPFVWSRIQSWGGTRPLREPFPRHEVQL